MTARYTHLRAAVSVGKCPRALTALRIRALMLSIAFVSGMKCGDAPARALLGSRFPGCRVRGVRRNQLGQAAVTP
jgi:hypothetical protein